MVLGYYKTGYNTITLSKRQAPRGVSTNLKKCFLNCPKGIQYVAKIPVNDPVTPEGLNN
jgi:hypothetical protein